METGKKYCKCGGAAGYLYKGGELVCQGCGGISPRAKLVGDRIVKIGENQVKCPQCGFVIQEARTESKIDKRAEDKMMPPPDNKAHSTKNR